MNKMMLKIVLALGLALSQGVNADHLTHSDTLCNKKVYIQSQLNGQHVAPNGASIDLTSTVERRLAFTIGCEFSADEFTFASAEDGKSGYLYAESKEQILTNRTYPGNSGKWRLAQQSDGSIGIVSLKFPDQYLSVDTSEHFSLINPSNSGLLANDKFRLVDVNNVTTITHVGSNVVWDSDGSNIVIQTPSGTKAGDLMVMVLHRTDSDLPLKVDGWMRGAECLKTDNDYACATASECTSWTSDRRFCERFGTKGNGEDLAQAFFFKRAGSNEPATHTINMNKSDSRRHPGWIVLSSFKGADTTNPVRAVSNKGCDRNKHSLFPSVYGEKGDLLLMSQSFDEAVPYSWFTAPQGTERLGYIGKSDESGFLFGEVLKASGQTGTRITTGSGAEKGGQYCKDALISITIKPMK